MKIYNKVLLIIAIGTVFMTVLYYCALALIPHFVDLNKYKEIVFSSVEKETGYKISSENIYFKRNLKPYLNIHLYHTAIMYPDNNVFLQIKEGDLKVKLLPLVFKQVIIKDAKFTRPIINITLYKDFSTSLEKYSFNKKIIDTKKFKFNGIANDALFENYKIKFKDETINKTFYLEGKELLLKDIQLNNRINLYINGAVYENKTEYIKYNIDLLSALNSKKHQFTFSPFKTIMESNVRGDINGNLKIDKDNNINGNLNIKNLSLKLSGIVSSDNNMDILFKGQDAEFNSVIHTSKTDIAKIKGKYSFGKKRYIDLNTNAKNINIENLFKIISSVSKVLNIQNPLNDLQIKGILNSDFNLNSDFKKLKSSGKAEIINAVINHKELPYPINDINANINFNNNNIKIEKADCKVNNTPITVEGNISQDLNVNINAYSENLDLKTVIAAFGYSNKLPVDISKGKFNFNSEIKGNIGKAVETVSDIHIKDIYCIDKKSKIPLSSEIINVNIETNDKKYAGNISIDKFKTLINKQPLNVEKLKFSFNEKEIQIPDNTLVYMDSPIKIKGSIRNYRFSPNVNVDFNGNLLSDNIATLIKPYFNAPHKALGRLNLSGKITSMNDKQTIRAQISANKDNYLSYAVVKELLAKPSVLNIDLDIQNKKITAKDITLYDASASHYDNSKKVFTANGEINNEKEIEFKNFKILIPNLISAKTNIFGGEDVSLKADLLFNKTIKMPEIKGNVFINHYNIKKYLTSIKNADISLTGDNIRLIAPDVQVNDSFFNIIADIMPEFNSNNITVTNMQINSLYLDLNSLFPLLSDRDIFSKSIINIKKGVATVNKFNILDIKAKDISSDFKVENNVIKLSDINASAYSGLIEGKSDYDLKSGMLNININGKGIDIKNSLYDLCKIEDNLSGKADFSSNISMHTGNYNTLLKSLNGSMQFNAQNGGMGTLGKFEYYLSAKNLMYHGLLNATLNRIAEALNHDKTEQYKSASGQVLFQNGYLITDGIQTTGTKMSLYMRGRHNLLTNQTNVDIYGRVSDDIKKKMGSSAGDVSISELFSGQSSRKDIVLTNVPKLITDKIPDLYEKNTISNTFKVNILGDIKSVNAINSFDWISPYEEEKVIDNDTVEQNKIESKKEESLPDFSDMTKEI